MKGGGHGRAGGDRCLCCCPAVQDRDFFERFLVVFFLRVADFLRELDDDFFADFFFEDFFFGTFLPSLRASDRPMAMACFRLLTFLPLLPLFSVPFFFRRVITDTWHRIRGDEVAKKAEVEVREENDSRG